jgi:hypothetical protein
MITIITAQVQGVCAMAISVMMCNGNKRDDIHAHALQAFVARRIWRWIVKLSVALLKLKP